MAERRSRSSSTTREELRKTQSLLPILHVNLSYSDAMHCAVVHMDFETYISPYSSFMARPQPPCCITGIWNVFPKNGIPGTRGGKLYFFALLRALRKLNVTMDSPSAMRNTSLMKGSMIRFFQSPVSTAGLRDYDRNWTQSEQKLA